MKPISEKPREGNKLKETKNWHEAVCGDAGNFCVRMARFCNKCGEYWTKENVCSNPWCPERMD